MSNTEVEMSLPQELKDEFNDFDKHPRMRGTGGNLDYLIVAVDPKSKMRLGIKPLFATGQNGQGKPITTLGFRIRSAPIDPEEAFTHQINEEPEIGEASEKVAPNEAFELPWENYPGDKIATYRASLIRMVGLNRSAEEIRQVPMDVHELRIAGKLYNFLLEAAPAETMTVSLEELTKWLDVEVDKFVTTVRAHLGDPKANLEALEQQKESFGQHYADKKAELEKAIAEAEAEGDEVEYHPKAHYAAEFTDSDSVVSAMIAGAKPNLSVVGSDDDSEATVEDADEEAATEELEGEKPTE